MNTYERCNEVAGCGLLVKSDYMTSNADGADVCNACIRVPERQGAARQQMLADGAFAAESVAAAKQLAGL